MTSVDDLFRLAIELRDNGRLRDSVDVLTRILNEHEVDKRKQAVYLVLGGVYADLGENENAAGNFRNAVQQNSNSELASLGLYVTLAACGKDDEAIHELMRYLSIHPADLYKDTLGELLQGLEKGYMTNYEFDIRSLAQKNRIRV